MPDDSKRKSEPLKRFAAAAAVVGLNHAIKVTLDACGPAALIYICMQPMAGMVEAIDDGPPGDEETALLNKQLAHLSELTGSSVEKVIEMLRMTHALIEGAPDGVAGDLADIWIADEKGGDCG